MVDRLSGILNSVRLRSLVWCRNELTAPWGIRLPGTIAEVPESKRPHRPAILATLPPSPGGAFYIITQGSCYIQIEGGEPPTLLNQGDIAVLLPRGKSHSVRDNPASTLQPIWDLRPMGLPSVNHVLRHGGAGPLTKFVYGIFHFENDSQKRLTSAIPSILCIRANTDRLPPWLDETIKLLTQEALSSDPGSRAVINHLVAILFIQAVRSFVAGLQMESDNWLRAFLDPEIGPALALIHVRPEGPWTVAALAKTASMSRSAFAAKFTELAQEPPLQYITACRMRKAVELLENRRMAIKEVAHSVGYESEAAFSVAFKRIHGVAPGIFRRRSLVESA